MPKKPKSKTKSVKSVPAQKATKASKSVSRAMEFFLAGCVAECYLLIVRRFYVYGTATQMLAWYDVLLYLLYIGLGLTLIGLALILIWRKAGGVRRAAAEGVLAAGVFLAVSGWVIRTVFPSGTTVLCIVVPALMLLGVLWQLYERECFLALSVLGLSVLVVWICRKGIGNEFWKTKVLIGVCIYLVLLALVALLAHRMDRTGGKFRGYQIMPADTDYLVVYGSCGLSAVAVAVSIFSVTAAYYALWVIALAIFALAVYYTVKQL